MGQGRYVGDLELPRMVHAAFLRSPHAHARITRLDPAGARAVPGFVACLTGEELARIARPLVAPSRMKTYTPTECPALARDRVRHVGEAVAIVAAGSRYAAEDAAEAIAVEYAPLPVVADVERAMA